MSTNAPSEQIVESRDPQPAAATGCPLDRLSVVIPALQAAAVLPGTLEVVRQGSPGQVIVVDGGSSDGTPQIAEREGAQLIAAARGRGLQLAAGARESGGDWLLFLHADTHLGAGWPQAVQAFMAGTGEGWRAGWFRLAFDDRSPAAARVARLANWRSRNLGLPYGDQGLLIPRNFYQALGGYSRQALMEDVELVRRIGRRRLAELPATATTSAERYRRDGWLRRPAKNLTLLALYFLGLPPSLLARLYR
ncbi:TIGR04283 family arsenosugar biosynthesis glycosyltransferase [Algihabitans albus]|uniref:TIGR04283 family arsenosugar biosynthesis glycosyltransferase n=1 Tax=Algihabitans albus TaxID=2164067 RepID=UPI000E5D41E8|nr:TIGR04283 family arsenosugar biosynthesis glycosyltransferase [Algihabitans albus]